MKFLIVLMLVAAPAFCQVSEQWGFCHPNNVLLFQRNVNFINNRAPNSRVTQTVQYPLMVSKQMLL